MKKRLIVHLQPFNFNTVYRMSVFHESLVDMTSDVRLTSVLILQSFSNIQNLHEHNIHISTVFRARIRLH